MGFHDLKLFLGQPSRLVQNLLVNADLADIMQRSRQRNQHLICTCDLVLCVFPFQLIQQQFCKALDVDDMAAAFSVPELYDLAENADHHAVVFVFLPYLFAYHGDQTPLFGVELDGVEHTAVDNSRIKRTADIV